MIMRYFVILILIGVLCEGSAVAAEEIRLKDGILLRGSIAAVNDSHSEYYFIHEDKAIAPRWISIREIKSIRYDAMPVVEKTAVPVCKTS